MSEKVTYTYLCDRCHMERERDNLFWGHLVSCFDLKDIKERGTTYDLCYSCWNEVHTEMKQYAYRNRLKLLVNEGIVVKEQ